MTMIKNALQLSNKIIIIFKKLFYYSISTIYNMFMFKESRKRTILKTLSWRITATVATTILVYLIVGKATIAITIGGLEAIIKLVLFYFHERFWNKITGGKHKIKPFVLWFTGLSGSGKSTLADLTIQYLKQHNLPVEPLDGDALRDVFPKTGFTREERNNHIKKAGYLASILEKNGVFVVASFMSPYQESREFVRNLTKNFIEIYISTSFQECEKRDVKGLYKLARAKKLTNFTGIDEPYEQPLHPELTIDTENISINKAFEQIKRYLEKLL